MSYNYRVTPVSLFPKNITCKLAGLLPHNLFLPCVKWGSCRFFSKIFGITQKENSILLCRLSSGHSNHYTCTNQCDGVVVRAFTLQLVDLGFIPQVESYQNTLKNGIHSFPAWCSAHRDSVENKLASLLVVPLGKTLNGMPPSLCGRQVVRAKQSTRHGGPVWRKTCKPSMSSYA